MPHPPVPFHSIRIYGATGPCSHSVNGSYEPVQQEDGVTYYVKHGEGSVCIEYMSSNKQWQVKQFSHRGKDSSLGYLNSLTYIPLHELVSGLWRVKDGHSYKEQASVALFVPASKAIRIAGAQGPRASAIDGVYFPINEVFNNASVYIKFDDPTKCIEYWVSNRTWQVKPASYRGKDHSMAYLASPVGLPIDLITDGSWRVYDGQAFIRQKSVEVIIPSLRPIRLSVIVAPYLQFIEGVYAAIPEDSSNGGTVYIKQDDVSIIIEYWSLTKQWQIKNVADRGQNKTLAWLTSSYAIPIEFIKNPHWIATVDEVTSESVQIAVSLVAGDPIHIYGATGENANTVNGPYVPTYEAMNTNPIYMKLNDASACIEYSNTQSSWVVKSLMDKGKEVAPIAALHSPTAIPLDIVVGGTWRIRDGPPLVDQTSIHVIIPAKYSVRISGATGPFASSINGIYDPSPEVVDGGTLYMKRYDITMCIEYYEASKQWQIKPLQNRGQKAASAFVACPTPVPLDTISEGGMWRVFNGQAFHRQPALLVTTPSTETVCIDGAYGKVGESLNGMYDASDDMSNGGTVYVKQGNSDKVIEYSEQAKQWQIKHISDKGMNSSLAFLASDKPIPLEKVLDGARNWMVDNGRSVFTRQHDLYVFVPALRNITIANATGRFAYNINGTFYPSTKVSNGASVYVKYDDDSIYIEYDPILRNWCIRGISTDKTKKALFATLAALQPLPIETIYGGIWRIRNGNQWEDQAAVTVVAPASQLVQINSVTGPYSAQINGTYIPLNNQVSNGGSVYVKQGNASIIVEYCSEIKCWQIKPVEEKGNNYAYAQLPSMLPIPMEMVSTASVWQVFTQAFQAQPLVSVVTPATQTIKLSGCTGHFATYVNGIYVPSSDVYNGGTVYINQNDDTMSICYNAKARQWQVKQLTDKSKDKSYCYLYTSLPAPLDSITHYCWRVKDGATFYDMPSILISIPALQSIRISGANGPHAAAVNGVYQPTDEIFNEAAVYLKVGSEQLKVIEYSSVLKQWQIKTIEQKRLTVSPVAFLPCALPKPIDMVSGQGCCWRVKDGQVFNRQATVSVMTPATRTIRLSGAQGMYALMINGIYTPNDEVCHSGSVYVKKDDKNVCIKYWKATNEWQVKRSEDKGKGSVCAAMSSPYPTPIEMIHGALWRVKDKEKFKDQTNISTSIPAMLAVRVYGATFKNAVAINGVYEPSEEISNGGTIYIKNGETAMCMEFWAASKQWQIKPAAYVGKDNCWAYYLHHSPTPLEMIPGGCWRVRDGSVYHRVPNMAAVDASIPVEDLVDISSSSVMTRKQRRLDAIQQNNKQNMKDETPIPILLQRQASIALSDIPESNATMRISKKNPRILKPLTKQPSAKRL